MDIPAILISQYRASLDMLKQTIIRCPEPIWDDGGDKHKFWKVAYHALFFTHLYVSDSEDTFVPWAKHRPEYDDFDVSATGAPLDKESMLEYLAFCWQHVAERVPQLDLEGSFQQRPYNKLELQIYSIRHIMQHTGELMDRLSGVGEEIRWVGSVRA